jgi:hypothetical protein
MRHFAIASAGFWILAHGLAFAQSEPVVVVELYTSQGCSSCPPADEFLNELIANPRVIPLALHVDYWDYIGWKDIFANPAFTERQKAYAYAEGSRTIYTPQMIINGTDRVEGNNPDAVNMSVANHLAQQSGDLSLSLVRNGDAMTITASSVTGDVTPLDVQLVRYKRQETVDITRGENAGRSISYQNIVTEWQVLGQWTPDTALAVDVTVSGNDEVVVILQKPDTGTIVAASRLQKASRQNGGISDAVNDRPSSDGVPRTTDPDGRVLSAPDYR